MRKWPSTVSLCSHAPRSPAFIIIRIIRVHLAIGANSHTSQCRLTFGAILTLKSHVSKQSTSVANSLYFNRNQRRRAMALQRRPPNNLWQSVSHPEIARSAKLWKPWCRCWTKKMTGLLYGTSNARRPIKCRNSHFGDNRSKLGSDPRVRAAVQKAGLAKLGDLISEALKHKLLSVSSQGPGTESVQLRSDAHDTLRAMSQSQKGKSSSHGNDNVSSNLEPEIPTLDHLGL